MNCGGFDVRSCASGDGGPAGSSGALHRFNYRHANIL